MFLDRPLPRYNDQELLDRAEQAKRYLSDPFFLSIMDEAEAVAIAEWLRNVDPAARERCWLLCVGIQTVMNTMRGTIDSAPRPDDPKPS